MWHPRIYAARHTSAPFYTSCDTIDYSVHFLNISYFTERLNLNSDIFYLGNCQSLCLIWSVIMTTKIISQIRIWIQPQYIFAFKNEHWASKIECEEISLEKKQHIYTLYIVSVICSIQIQFSLYINIKKNLQRIDIAIVTAFIIILIKFSNKLAKRTIKNPIQL